MNVRLCHRRSGLLISGMLGLGLLLGMVTAPSSATTIVSAKNVAGCVIKPKAKCPNTDFGGKSLKKAKLQDANLRGSRFRAANVTGANLTGADLRGIDAGGTTVIALFGGKSGFKEGPWMRVKASGANLTEAEFADGNLARADLRGANLTDFFATRTRMAGADLSGATMVRAEIYGNPDDPKDRKRMGRGPFRGLNLSDVDLTDGLLSFDLAGVNLTGANLTRANLGGAENLDQAITDGAIFCGTIAPGGYSETIDTNC